MKYCESLTSLIRFNTIRVMVGGIPMGGKNPIRIQTMTTTDTNDADATVEQCIRTIKAGAELVRITAQGVKEAKSIEIIKRKLVEKGYNTPIVVDIHFNPSAALEAAQHADKVRINPGNYADPRASFKSFDYTEEEYQNELAKVEEKLIPLINICKNRGIPLRIGVNHGSLSDRIMSRFGDTPEGMVESALEFIRICNKNNFHQLVISMKASNTRVMVYASRLLVNKMLSYGKVFPLHLGVTEAGDGEDGRIKSAVGIGSLLADGIGDTIRVSLTEDPELEIPVAKKLVEYFKNRETNPAIYSIDGLPYNPFSYNKRLTNSIGIIGRNNVPVVVANLIGREKTTVKDLQNWGWYYSTQMCKWTANGMAADYFLIDENVQLDIKAQDELPIIKKGALHSPNKPDISGRPLFITLSYADLNDNTLVELKNQSNLVILLETNNSNGFAEQRAAFIKLMENGITCPVIISRKYDDTDIESFQLKSASDIGALLIDGLGDGIMIMAPNIEDRIVCSTSFSILQASRTRVSKTEFISCPGCGRTLFRLQETLNRIRSRTGHLKGLKIGVMGCIVNGPGEMADADYGYVGAGPGKINLYKGKEVVKKNIPEEQAVEELINLIKENGDWKEIS